MAIKPTGGERTPMFGSKDIFVKNNEPRPKQPILDKYRQENKFERHPPKTHKAVSKSSYNDPNVVGNKNLQMQIDIAGEQDQDSVDGL